MINDTFLKHVAKDIIGKFGTDLSKVAIVFPNKRAALFMNEHFARLTGKPIWSPAYITISELFRKHSQKTVGDSIKLICDLHRSFVKCTGLSETLDHFYAWGQLLLADFDDIDKNMADADNIFCNLKDLHELDDISYLDDEQRTMLKRFFANFTDEKESELKKRFLSLWSHFSDIYHDYNKRLGSQGILYEGALYRKVAEMDDINFKYDTYIFVGFNLLHKVEQILFDKLKKIGKARFYWDYDKYYMPHPAIQKTSVAGHYIDMYMHNYPNELNPNSEEIYNNMQQHKDITYISAATENAQARYVSSWLKENDRYKDGEKTAIVMCDENILLPVMQSIPSEAEKVNITSGYPLNMTPVASLVALLLDMYTFGYKEKADSYRTIYSNRVLLHPYTRYISEKAKDVYDYIKNNHIKYADRNLLNANGTDEQLDILFAQAKPLAANEPDANANKWLLQQIGSIVKLIGRKGHADNDALFQESVFRMYTIVNRLCTLAESGDLEVDINTLRRLLRQLIITTSIPFHGEPVVGIQIMGVLETRNLDFDHILLLSCNEGKMPKGVNDSSFIPYSIRKAYGLTTIDNKVAIYSYYFHRLLQRAQDVTLVYNNAADKGKTGEMSRFMLQLMVNSQHEIKHKSLVAKNNMPERSAHEVKKDKEIVTALEGMKSISPSAINKYLNCPLIFFYMYVAKIKEPDTEEDIIDNRMFGNIFHKSAQIIYEDMAGRGSEVTEVQIDNYLNQKNLLPAVVDRAFNEELFKTHANKRGANYNGLQLINREVIIRYLRKLLRLDRKYAPFTIIALEDSAYMDIKLWERTEKERSISTGGFIDRLDMITDKTTGKKRIRVVDYKTGKEPSQEIKDVVEIFEGKATTKNHSDYFLQTFLYSIIVEQSKKLNPQHEEVSPALLFIARASADDYDPTLSIAKEKVTSISKYKDEYLSGLKNVIEEILNPNISFKPKADAKKCSMCPYKSICEINQ